MDAKKPKLFIFAVAIFAILLAGCQPITAEPMMESAGLCCRWRRCATACPAR